MQSLIEDLAECPEIDETLTGFHEGELNELVMAPRWDGAIDSDQDDDRVSVTLMVEPEDWSEVEAALDELLDQFDVELHVRKGG